MALRDSSLRASIRVAMGRARLSAGMLSFRWPPGSKRRRSDKLGAAVAVGGIGRSPCSISGEANSYRSLAAWRQGRLRPAAVAKPHQPEGQVMPNWSQRAVAADVTVGLLHAGKVYQVIFNVNVRTTPPSARISFEPMLDAVGFVTLYQDGVQIRGAFVTPGHYGVTFTDLPQNTEFAYQIDVLDPRPKAEQHPGGIVRFSGILETGLRTASVRFSRLKELQGECEATFFTRLYDWDGTSGPAISPILQYGRGHMDPEGSPIGDPFGPPTLLARAPDNLAIYTEAAAQTSGDFIEFVTDPGGGIHVIGIGSLDEFPNDAPDLR